MLNTEEIANAAAKGLKYSCPTCREPIEVPFMTVATQIVKRRCRKCRQRWQLKVEPKNISVGMAHIAEFTKI